MRKFMFAETENQAGFVEVEGRAYSKKKSLSDGLDASIKKHFAPLARVPSDSFGRVAVSPTPFCKSCGLTRDDVENRPHWKTADDSCCESLVITLFKASGFWMAQHSGPGREEITSLFGTDTLPTPFTDAASFESVRDVLERLNPGAKIVMQ